MFAGNTGDEFRENNGLPQTGTAEQSGLTATHEWGQQIDDHPHPVLPAQGLSLRGVLAQDRVEVPLPGDRGKQPPVRFTWYDGNMTPKEVAGQRVPGNGVMFVGSQGANSDLPARTWAALSRPGSSNKRVASTLQSTTMGGKCR